MKPIPAPIIHSSSTSKEDPSKSLLLYEILESTDNWSVIDQPALRPASTAVYSSTRLTVTNGVTDRFEIGVSKVLEAPISTPYHSLSKSCQTAHDVSNREYL